MSNIDNLITKIISDCEEESRHIKDAAHTEASAVIQKCAEAAEKEKEQLLGEAESEAQRTAEQMLLSKRLEIRDGNLSAKREIMDKVYSHVLKKLNGMEKVDYIKYLRTNLLALSPDGGEIILPKKYGISEEEFYSLFEGNQMAGLRFYKGEKQIDGGFVLMKEGIEYNRTFEVLLQYCRYDLESDLIKILF